MEQIRVLHVLGTTNLGGAESRVMELYRAMNRENVQFDFLIHTTKDGSYSEEIRRLGGNIYSLPRFKVYNYFAYKKAIRDFFETHEEFSAVHGHMTSTASIYLPIAKKVYQKKGKYLLTIAHARSAGVDRGIKGSITKCLRRNLKKKTDYCFTCSREAGEAVFGKEWVEKGKVKTIPNSISCKRFQYDESVRNSIRKELGLEDKFVIGHVGRFGFMKNHTFLVDVFQLLQEKDASAALVLIGKGEEETAIREKVKTLGLDNKVHFLGNHFDVERYYQAFDYFVFPSTFEGFPGSVLEAQASGLHCLVSDKVTKEVALTPLVSYRSIEEEPVKWADEILQHKSETGNRKVDVSAIRERGYDVDGQAALMEEFYRTGKCEKL